MLKRFVSFRNRGSKARLVNAVLSSEEFIWGLGSLCALNRVAFDPKLVLNQFPLPHTSDAFIRAIRHIGFKSKNITCLPHKLQTLSFPCFAFVKPKNLEDGSGASIVLISDASSEHVVLFEPGTNAAVKLSLEAFSQRYLGSVVLAA